MIRFRTLGLTRISVGVASGILFLGGIPCPAALGDELLPPVITAQPQSQSIAPSSMAQLSVGAQGTEPLTYQWWKNGAKIVGASNATWLVSNAQALDAGQYLVVVSNPYGEVTSDTVSLTVTVPGAPVIITQPRKQTTNTAARPGDLHSVAGGNGHALIVQGDGTVRASGHNSHGQLGDGTTSARLSAVPVLGLGGIVAVSAGGYHSLALRADGTVWAWGDNRVMQLGGGTLGVDRPIPRQVNGLSEVAGIAAGQSHNLAVKRDGTVWAWGDNSHGQLGDGTLKSRASPVQVSGIEGGNQGRGRIGA